MWNLIANLAVPIFDGGRLRARADETEALHDESLATWAGLLLRAFSEVVVT